MPRIILTFASAVFLLSQYSSVLAQEDDLNNFRTPFGSARMKGYIEGLVERTCFYYRVDAINEKQAVAALIWDKRMASVNKTWWKDIIAQAIKREEGLLRNLPKGDDSVGCLPVLDVVR